MESNMKSFTNAVMFRLKLPPSPKTFKKMLHRKLPPGDPMGLPMPGYFSLSPEELHPLYRDMFRPFEKLGISNTYLNTYKLF